MKQFDFEQVGKRMPYNVPDGFFDKLEADVMPEVNETAVLPNKRKNVLRIALRAAMAVAASVVVFFVVKAMLPKNEATGFEAVELAFNNLSTEDQEYLLLVYEQDLFINEIEEEE